MGSLKGNDLKFECRQTFLCLFFANEVILTR